MRVKKKKKKALFTQVAHLQICSDAGDSSLYLQVGIPILGPSILGS